MAQQIRTYEEACAAVTQWGILPLSSFIPDHPSLESLTLPGAWHTGLESDPWLWRDRFPGEGVAAYGRFFAHKPLLVSKELFPLLKCVLDPGEPLEERYAAGLLARSTLHLYELISEQPGIDVKALRKAAGMRDKSEKNAFDRSLIELQSCGEVVIAGISERLNEHGNKSGWNSACYTLAEQWMSEHDLVPLTLTRSEAQTRLFAWLEPRCSEEALRYLRGKLK